MGILEGLGTEEGIQKETDSLGVSFGAVDSALYNVDIKYAYVTESAGGAKALNLVLVTEDKKEIRNQQWMTSGTAKGGHNYYMIKKDGNETGEKAYLPGFSMANGLALLTAGKGIGDLSAEKQTIKLYDFNAGGEVDTEVDMIPELVGKQITAGIFKQIVDKRVKDENNKYVPSGETREENEVDKWFRAKDGLTVTEIEAKTDTPVFRQKWSDRWTGVTRERFDKDAVAAFKANGGKAGAPTAAGGVTSLFQ